MPADSQTDEVVILAERGSLLLPIGAAVAVLIGAGLAVFSPSVSPLPRLRWIDTSPVAKAIFALAALMIGVVLLSVALRLALGSPLLRISVNAVYLIKTLGYRRIERADVVDFHVASGSGQQQVLMIVRNTGRPLRVTLKPRGAVWDELLSELMGWLRRPDAGETA